MSDYKRLTKSDNTHRPYRDECFKCIGRECNRCDYDYEVWERLAELEDKIEQGKLCEINDKLIGESVYGIQQDTTGKYWFDGDENTLLGFTSDGIVVWNDNHGYNDWFRNGLWFLTREEAEKRLKELQE